MLTLERLRTTKPEIPFIPFPQNPKTIKVGKYEVYEYTSPETMRKILGIMAVNTNFKEFDEVLVNMNGGEFLFNELSKFRKHNKKPIQIEYHRPKGGHSAIETIPVPKTAWTKKFLFSMTFWTVVEF